MELLRFAAESLWNLFVTISLVCTIGVFLTIMVAAIAEGIAHFRPLLVSYKKEGGKE